jgi:hypothetical protein
MSEEKSAREEASSNARVGRILKFVTQPPKRGEVMRLRTLDALGLQLGEWDREQAENNGEVAQEVNARLVDACKEAGCEVSALLFWVNSEERTLASKKLTARPEANSMAEAVMGLDSTDSGRVVQMQQHLHTMMAEHLKGIRDILESYKENNAELRDMVRDQNAMLRDAYRDRHELSAALAEATMPAEETAAEEKEPAASPESEARAELVREVTSIVKHVGGAAAMQAVKNAMGGSGEQKAS